MITLMSMMEVRTGSCLSDFRAIPHSTGIPTRLVGPVGSKRSELLMLSRQSYRLWRIRQWQDHFKCVIGSLNVLPPSARQQLLDGRDHRKDGYHFKY